SFTTKAGLSHNNIMSIHEDRMGNLWVGTAAGLDLLKDGKIKVYKNKDNLSSRIKIIYTDIKGNLWLGTPRGLGRFIDGKISPYTPEEGVFNEIVTAIGEDRQENLYIGTLRGGLSRLEDGKFTTVAVTGGAVSCIYNDREGKLWVGTAGGGLYHLKDGEFKRITTRNGFFANDVYQIMEDDSNNLWMGCGDGIYRVSKQDLEDCFSTGQNLVTYIAYNEKDGMKSRFCSF
ncbi:MAG: hypothetical protein GY940_00005, partial [bacterium]|nr:hypothetical protein [bacterium]